jgi:hypothetical protein
MPEIHEPPAQPQPPPDWREELARLKAGARERLASRRHTLARAREDRRCRREMLACAARAALPQYLVEFVNFGGALLGRSADADVVELTLLVPMHDPVLLRWRWLAGSWEREPWGRCPEDAEPGGEAWYRVLKCPASPHGAEELSCHDLGVALFLVGEGGAGEFPG